MPAGWTLETEASDWGTPPPCACSDNAVGRTGGAAVWVIAGTGTGPIGGSTTRDGPSSRSASSMPGRPTDRRAGASATGTSGSGAAISGLAGRADGRSRSWESACPTGRVTSAASRFRSGWPAATSIPASVGGSSGREGRANSSGRGPDRSGESLSSGTSARRAPQGICDGICDGISGGICISISGGISGDAPTGDGTLTGPDEVATAIVGANSTLGITAIGRLEGSIAAPTAPTLGGSGVGTPSAPTAMGSAFGTGAGPRNMGARTIGTDGVSVVSIGRGAVPGSNQVALPDMAQVDETAWVRDGNTAAGAGSSDVNRGSIPKDPTTPSCTNASWPAKSSDAKAWAGCDVAGTGMVAKTGLGVAGGRFCIGDLLSTLLCKSRAKPSGLGGQWASEWTGRGVPDPEPCKPRPMRLRRLRDARAWRAEDARGDTRRCRRPMCHADYQRASATSHAIPPRLSMDSTAPRGTPPGTRPLPRAGAARTRIAHMRSPRSKDSHRRRGASPSPGPHRLDQNRPPSPTHPAIPAGPILPLAPPTRP